MAWAGRTWCRKTAARPGGGGRRQAVLHPRQRVEANYYVPHCAHATMEPLAATAQIVDGRCEIRAASQSPQAAHDRVAKRLNLAADNAIANDSLLAGGFGRKSKANFVVKAALILQHMRGKPVKLTWTREDDLHHDYFHAVSAQHLAAGMDADGKASAWPCITAPSPLWQPSSKC